MDAATYIDDDGVERCDECWSEVYDCDCTCDECGDPTHECSCDD